jgi:hypothetical protein
MPSKGVVILRYIVGRESLQKGDTSFKRSKVSKTSSSLLYRKTIFKLYEEIRNINKAQNSNKKGKIN